MFCIVHFTVLDVGTEIKGNPKLKIMELGTKIGWTWKKRKKNENWNHPLIKKLEPKLSFIFEKNWNRIKINLLKNVKNQNWREGSLPSRIKELTNIRLEFNSLEIHQCQFDSFIFAQSLFWKLWKIEYQT